MGIEIKKIKRNILSALVESRDRERECCLLDSLIREPRAGRSRWRVERQWRIRDERRWERK